MVKLCLPNSSFTSTTDPTPTTPPSGASSMTTALRSMFSRTRMRPSTMPCSFFASSYSAFSEMSPKSLAYLMRSATSDRRTVRNSSSSRSSLMMPSLVSRTGLSMMIDLCLDAGRPFEALRRESGSIGEVSLTGPLQNVPLLLTLSDILPMI